VHYTLYLTDYKLKQTRLDTQDSVPTNINHSTLNKNSPRQGRNTGLNSSGTNELDKITRAMRNKKHLG